LYSALKLTFNCGENVEKKCGDCRDFKNANLAWLFQYRDQLWRKCEELM
jgi:hypothetical protein